MPNFYNILRARKFSTAADTAFEVAPYDSATPNFSIEAGGRLKWSSGSAVADTNLYRSAANVLKTDDSFDLAFGHTYKIDGADVLTSISLGSAVVGSSLTSVGSLTSLSAATPSFTGPLTSNGTTNIQQIREKTNTITVSGGVLTCNYINSGIFYVDNAGASTFTVNITNLPTDNDYAITVTIMVKQGATVGYPNAVQIAGASTTLKWPNGGSAPSPSVSGKYDMFTFTLHRVGGAWVVFGSFSLNY